MKDSFIKNIIHGFNKYYGYGVIELKDNRLRTNWALVKSTTYNEKRVIIFTNRPDEIEYISMSNNIKAMLNCENIELIRVFLNDNENQEISPIDYERKVELILDLYNRKIESSNLKSDEIVKELLNVMNSLQGGDINEPKEKPYITYSLIAINIFMYIITAFLSQNIFDSDINVLIKLGAKYNELISKGEYYRFITSMFLHGGLLHVALNMYSLYSIGPLIERVYGKAKYIIIYFISGITASIFSYLFSDSVSIGASGAIFGLLGTTLVFAIRLRKAVGKNFLISIASVIAINLYIGFSLPNIDNYAHLGGLIGGVIMALVFYKIKKD